MADRERCLDRIANDGIVVIVRGAEREKLIPLGEALLAGGIHAMEITFDPTGKESADETAEAIAILTKHFGDRMEIGAGTVLTTGEVKRAAKAGASFIVSPNADRSVIKKTRALSLVSIPGALTPTEIQNAHLSGADLVKVFPASVLGAEGFRLISVPLRHIRLAAVGGITLDDLSVYRAAGAFCFCVGGAIADKKLLAENDFAGITAQAKRFVEAMKKN